MRTTLDIDEDVLLAAKELAAKEKKTAGQILSEYFRRGAHSVTSSRSPRAGKTGFTIKNGIPVVPSRGEVVTLEKVGRIMEEEGI